MNKEEQKKFYLSRTWANKREEIRERDGYICKLCHYKDGGITTIEGRNNITHHIVPLKEDKSKALNSDNLLTMCHSCHDEVEEYYRIKRLKKPIQELLKKLVKGFFYREKGKVFDLFLMQWKERI